MWSHGPGILCSGAKSGHKGAASRADQLLDKMEAKYLAGDMDLKPNTFTYNAVINALAKSGEAGAAARGEAAAGIGRPLKAAAGLRALALRCAG